ncbi:MAG: hypothetical protein FJX37_10640 [Alphaproteobacteria bacterium]|nr:hypothetical protein [Alphaproteobacteria bacterium]MBM3952203.1 hypothetical protein [Rhodospirillales bacterium]
MAEAFHFEKEMSETRASLARGLVRLLGPCGAAVADLDRAGRAGESSCEDTPSGMTRASSDAPLPGRARLEIADGTRRLVLEIADMPPRKFGPIDLPVLRVAATLTGYAPGEAEAFQRDFERTFQRGGG